MLQVTDLTFDYSDKFLLQNISFSVEEGIVLHVKGKNGSGKTTLLKLLAGLMQPLSGDIFYQGRIAYLGHQNGVNTHLTPYEHLRFDLGVLDDVVLNNMLNRMILQDARDMPCALLSSGQKRRVGLLRLLITEATLWLLDEPLVGLDEAGMQVLSELIQSHLKQRGSIVLTSHQNLPFDLDAGVLKALVL